MHYTPEDYESLYGERHTSNHVDGWAMVAWLVCLIILAALLGCTDYADAANIAQDVREADEKHQTVMAWWYSETYQPIKASDANSIVTVCQQTDSTINWYCHAGARTR